MFPLQALHSASYLHGDLKPSNVLLSGDGRPMVADLGSALQHDPCRGTAGIHIGTYTYLVSTTC